jgi:hypothetical protein
MIRGDDRAAWFSITHAAECVAASVRKAVSHAVRAREPWRLRQRAEDEQRHGLRDNGI